MSKYKSDFGIGVIDYVVNMKYLRAWFQHDNNTASVGINQIREKNLPAYC